MRIIRPAVETALGDRGTVHEFFVARKEPMMEKWKCTLCGYVYDPAKGDPDSDIEPGTAFEALPDDWVCPDCGAGKEDFEKV